MRAAMEYHPRLYRGSVDLFQPDACPIDRQASLHLELRHLVAGDLRVHPVPGDHYSILQTPLAAVLATRLDAAVHSATTSTRVEEGMTA
jgi:hypothetical protein